MSFTSAETRAWLAEQDCDLDAFRTLVEQPTDLADFPYASSVERNVLVYDSDRLRKCAWRLSERREVQTELVRAFAEGPGIVVLQGTFPDLSVVDRATEVFDALIAEQRASGAGAGDHFAKPGANDRVWNALEKAALYDPEAFADYYANDILALVSGAWLGPGYQVTSQINVVHPGGAAQTVHRDYHLGFLTNEAAASYPAHVHRLSPVLTLQGRSRTATCRWSRGRRCICRTPRSSSRAIWRGDSRSSRPTSRPTHPTPARQGRCGVLQPGALPRGGHQPHGGRAAHGEPAPGVVRVRAGDGDGGP